MKALKNTIASALILFISVSATAQNNTVYFPFFELINLNEDPNLQYSSSKLLKSYIEDNQRFRIILPETKNTYYTYQSEQLVIEEAIAYNAGYYLRGELHELGGILIISLGLYETNTGNRVWHDMVKGSTINDIDPLLSRLGRSFLSNRTAKRDIEIDEVTEYDARGLELQQIKVNHFVGIMLGGKHLFDGETLSGFGLYYTYDASTFLFNLNFDLYPSSSLLENERFEGRKLRNGNFSIGASLPFTRKRSTLYLEGGLEYGFMSIHRDPDFYEDTIETNGGVGVYFGGGYLINRNSTVNLRVFSAVSIPMYTIEDRNYPGLKFGMIISFSK